MSLSDQELVAIRIRLSPDYREHLLDRALSETLQRRIGVERPLDDGQAETLLGYGYGMLSAAVEMRRASMPESTNAFISAAEAFESSVRYVGYSDDLDFNTVLAAASYHLGNMNAKAYILVNRRFDNLSPVGHLFVYLMLRRFNLARTQIRQILRAAELPAQQRFSGDDIDDISSKALTLSYHLAIAALLTYFSTGDTRHLERGRERLQKGGDLSAKWGFAATSMIYDLTLLFFADFEHQSYHAVLPPGPDDQVRELRNIFIDRLASINPAQVDLWPSQIDCAKRAFEATGDLVAVLPTSAGKTRIAEIAMIPVLASGRDVIYITPLRALSAQVERELSEVFGDSGYRVSRVYDTAAWQFDGIPHRIQVATPEKFDFSLRHEPRVLDNIGLVIFDEAHLIGTGDRELRYELLIDRLRRCKAMKGIRVLCLSALMGSSDEDIRRFTTWISDGESAKPIISSWRPTRRAFGTMSWRNNALDLEIERQGDVFTVERFVEQIAVAQKGRGGKVAQFPASDDWQIVLAAAFKFAAAGETVLIYNTLKVSAKLGARTIIELVDRGALTPPPFEANFFSSVDRERLQEWMGPDHEVTRCLLMGIAIHHGDLPLEILSIVERMIKDRRSVITVASPSIAQGINISASTIIFRSLYRINTLGRIDVIPLDEFLNVVGRAGRAYVDIEGQILLHLGKDGDPTGKDRNAWHELVSAGRNKRLESGLFQLVKKLLVRVGAISHEAIDFITQAINVTRTIDGKDLRTEDDYNSDVDALDDALVSLFGETDSSAEDAAAVLDVVLSGSFFVRCIEDLEASMRAAILDVVRGRGRSLIERYSASQRRSAYLSGIRVRTSADFESLVSDLSAEIYSLEALFASPKTDSSFVDRLSNVALSILESPCFQSSRRAAFDVPEPLLIIRRWLSGEALADISRGDDSTMAFVDDALRYRVVWGLDAIRAEMEDDQPDQPLSLLFSYGVANRLALMLLLARLGSRPLAIEIAESAPLWLSPDEWISWILDSQEIIASRLSAGRQAVLFNFIDAIRRDQTVRVAAESVHFRPANNASFSDGDLAIVLPTDDASQYEITDHDLRTLGFATASAGLAFRPSGNIGTIRGSSVYFDKFGGHRRG